MNERQDSSQREWVRSVLQQYEGPLLRYAQRITGDLERARDVVQETFLRLWKQSPPSLNGRMPQWLFRVCRNLALDVRRKEQRMTSLANPLSEHSTVADPSPAEQAANNETVHWLLKWLQRLPDNQQEVVRLKFQNGLKYREIAEITGLTVSHVGLLIHQALQSLREKARQLESEGSPLPVPDPAPPAEGMPSV